MTQHSELENIGMIGHMSFIEGRQLIVHRVLRSLDRIAAGDTVGLKRGGGHIVCQNWRVDIGNVEVKRIPGSG